VLFTRGQGDLIGGLHDDFFSHGVAILFAFNDKALF
jgi:hypothetical protein